MGTPHLTPDERPANAPLILRFPTAAETARDALRLRGAYEKFISRNQKLNRSPATVVTYETALRHWERYSGDPPVVEITDATLDEFASRFLADGATTGNLKKVWTNLRHIFRRLSRREIGNPRGLPHGTQLLEWVPYLEVVADEPPPPRVMTDPETWSRIYRAARIAAHPQRAQQPAPLVWRAAFVVWANYGLRRSDLVALEWDEHVKFDARCPDPRIDLDNPHGWLVFIPWKTRRKKPQPLMLPLNEITRRHLEAIRGPRSKVFQLSARPATLHNWRRKIQAVAGIEDPYTFKDFRATCNVAWNRLSRGLGEHVLGHAPRGVNQTHYFRALADLVEFAPLLPQPEAFLEFSPADLDQQLRLFE